MPNRLIIIFTLLCLSFVSGSVVAGTKPYGFSCGNRHYQDPKQLECIELYRNSEYYIKNYIFVRETWYPTGSHLPEWEMRGFYVCLNNGYIFYNPNTDTCDNKCPDGAPADARGYCPVTTPIPEKNSGPPDMCPEQTAGTNPINIAVGNKYQAETDLPVLTNSPLAFIRAYNSIPAPSSGFGPQWHHTYSGTVRIDPSLPNPVTVIRPGGRHLKFVRTGGRWQGDADIPDRLEQLTDATGQPAGWRYTVAKDRSIETYNTDGQPVSIASAEGHLQTLTYTDGLLTRVQDHTGRTLQFAYDTEGRITTLTDPLGQLTTYTYTPTGLLASVQYPDTTQRQYHYNEPAFINNGTACSTAPEGFPTALTGLTDQNGTRYATFTYDCQGRATSSVHAGQTEHIQLAFPSDNTVTATDPLGNVRTYGFKTIQGVVRRTSLSQPAGSGCAASTAQIGYDTHGNIIEKTDFNGTKTCSTYDLSRNLETARVEGLPASQNCGTALAAATLGDAQRKTTTQWHPHWSLITQRAAPNRIITSVYNGQPDPSNNNAILTCAPASAILPNGQPPAVLCKQIEQPTTDTDGSKGFNAAPAGTARITEWTYDVNGKTLTERDADGRTLTYTYAPATTATHTAGDLLSLSDTLGVLTTYTAYDRAGRLLESQDTNGIITRLAYDARGRLKSQNVGGHLTRYTYTSVGQLSTVTQPDGYQLIYTYDAAHRLTGITDTLGNRIATTYDAAGNLTRETIADPHNQLTRAVTRHHDALQRVQRTVQGD